MRSRPGLTPQVSAGWSPVQKLPAAWSTQQETLPIAKKTEDKVFKGHHISGDWVTELRAQTSNVVVGQQILPFADSEPCCVSLTCTKVEPRFVTFRLGPLLLNDTIQKEGSIKIAGDWNEEIIRWVIPDAPLQKMASQSPIGIVACRVKLWAVGNLGRRWIGRTSPSSVPLQSRSFQIGDLNVVIGVSRGIDAELAMKRGAVIVSADNEITPAPAIDTMGPAVLHLTSERQWALAAAMICELKAASRDEQCQVMAKSDHTKRTALRICVDGQWEEQPPVMQCLENAFINAVIGARRPYFWLLHITAVCHRTKSFLGETQIGMPRSKAGFKPGPCSGFANVPAASHCQWSDPQPCQGTIELTWESASQVGRLTLDQTELKLILVGASQPAKFGAAIFRNPLPFPMLAVEGSILRIAASGVVDMCTSAKVIAELQPHGPREVAMAIVACGADPHDLADDGLSAYTAALLGEDPCNLLADLTPSLRSRIRKGEALAWAEVGRSSLGIGRIDLVAAPLTRGLAVPDELAEGLLEYCFQRNLPLLAVRVLSRIDGQQKLLAALERAEDPQWLRVAERTLQQSHATTPLWFSAKTLAYALEEIRKGRRQFRLLLHAFLGHIHSIEPDFYTCPAALTKGGAECSICFEPLFRNAPVAFTDEDRAVCPHFLCSNCARGYAASASSTGATLKCPECRRPGAKVSLVPQLSEDPLAWFDFLASSSGVANRTMLLRVISAMLPVDADRLQEALSDGQITSQPLEQEVTAAEFLANGLYAWIRRHESEIRRSSARGPSPNISNKVEWFRYWDFSQSGLLSRGEVLRAFLKTYEVSSLDKKRVNDLRRHIDRLWDQCTAESKRKYGHFSTQGVSVCEFVDPGGLGDLLEQTLASGKEVMRESSLGLEVSLWTAPNSQNISDQLIEISAPGSDGRERRRQAPLLRNYSARIAASNPCGNGTLSGREAWADIVERQSSQGSSEEDTQSQPATSIIAARVSNEVAWTSSDCAHSKNGAGEETYLYDNIADEFDDMDEQVLPGRNVAGGRDNNLQLRAMPRGRIVTSI